MRRLLLPISFLLTLIVPTPLFSYERIISLKPNITEIVFALGAGDKLVGVTNFCKRPAKARSLPKVADYIKADPEKILRLQPDLILASKENSSQKEIHFLEARGIPVELLSFQRLADLKISIQKMGALLERVPQAQALVENFEKELASLKPLGKNHTRLKALLVVGYEPLVVVGGNNFIDESITHLGISNVAGQSRMSYPTYSTEQLIRSAPEIIIDLPMGTENTPDKAKKHLQWWNRFPSIPAVRDGRIFTFPVEEMAMVPTLPEALKKLSALIGVSRPPPKPLSLPLKNPRIVVNKGDRRLFLYDGETLLRDYAIGLGFEPKGTKLKQGDGKTPEGRYRISEKNPKSQYYLSLALNYPKAEDGRRGLEAGLISRQEYRAILRSDRNGSTPPWDTALGGEMFIHGHGSKSDWTLGCIALDNAAM
ncbi:MAG: helical backbone metal receptor, partial [bacterium]|nr:helical backbone metal receptor [bacterium]